MKKALALILSVVMCVGLFAGCGQQNDANNGGDQDQGSTAKTLVVGTQNFDGKFSPFFYTNDYENQVMSMVFDVLLGTDREGSVPTTAPTTPTTAWPTARSLRTRTAPLTTTSP